MTQPPIRQYPDERREQGETDTLAALQPPAPAHDAGPTVCECADNDRRWWNGEKAGE